MDALIDRERQDNLDEARSASKNSSVKDTSNLAKDISAMKTPMGALSLTKQINLLADAPYVAAIGAALLKDILDEVMIGSLPGLGTVLTICCSIFIGMMMLLVSGTGKRKNASSAMKKIATLVGGTIVEIIPGINFIPIETATVIFIYFMVLSERKNSSR